MKQLIIILILLLSATNCLAKEKFLLKHTSVRNCDVCNKVIKKYEVYKSLYLSCFTSGYANVRDIKSSAYYMCLTCYYKFALIFTNSGN